MQMVQDKKLMIDALYELRAGRKEVILAAREMVDKYINLTAPLEDMTDPQGIELDPSSDETRFEIMRENAVEFMDSFFNLFAEIHRNVEAIKEAIDQRDI